jgi:lysine-ketoglutarate reductase/saccharopine dehydrogenase-like protein (TIGR00300 family)
MDRQNRTPGPAMYTEEVEIHGHIIDSLIFPKVLNHILSNGGTFQIKHVAIGRGKEDPSHAVIAVQAADRKTLHLILAHIADDGAEPTTVQDCDLAVADVDGAFPDAFYSTTNQRTEIRLAGRWLPVADQEMDCGIRLDLAAGSAGCVPMTEVRRGDQVVTGHAGIRVIPEARPREPQVFGFMESSVSTEKPKGAAIREVAHTLVQTRAAGGKTLLVGGPAIVHSGSGEFVEHLIRRGYINVLLAGNALAAHDIEHALFGTSLGVYLDHGGLAEAGHEHHLRAINRIRRAGGIRRAVEEGLLRSGIMYECVRNGVDFLLAGSIRDDGPLPEVITDVLMAQRRMRELIRGVSFCLMIATTLHSIAVGNLLPAWVKVVCVDINPSTVIKLSDRGSLQTAGLVTDAAPFLRVLVDELNVMEAATKP